FAEYDRCVYMPLPPLGPADGEVITACFDWMDRANPSPAISRIENIADTDRSFYQECGLAVDSKDPEYFYRQADLAGLKGDRYKTQRWRCNHFEKKARPTCRPYTAKDQAPSLSLYEKWLIDRGRRHPDTIYCQMLVDSEAVHRRALAERETLGLTGRVVEASDRIVGYTFGFPQNANTFCIVLEVADADAAGASAFLFRSFCQTLNGFTWINAMDDSGLENLKRAKASYHPEKKVRCYLARHAGFRAEREIRPCRIAHRERSQNPFLRSG
ncbi:MAG: phosphatidylglycerol lysyltransferase domain-containing protein, partial [Nitrospiria bacterium]